MSGMEEQAVRGLLNAVRWRRIDSQEAWGLIWPIVARLPQAHPARRLARLINGLAEARQLRGELGHTEQAEIQAHLTEGAISPELARIYADVILSRPVECGCPYIRHVWSRHRHRARSHAGTPHSVYWHCERHGAIPTQALEHCSSCGQHDCYWCGMPLFRYGCPRRWLCAACVASGWPWVPGWGWGRAGGAARRQWEKG
jgi:hypothetical protein